MKTSHNAIQALMEKYLEGQTSLEEETLLQRYFNDAEKPIDPSWEWARDVFLYAHNEQQLKVSLAEPSTRRSSGISWMRIAASFALLIVTFFGVYRLQEEYQERKMQEAYAETKKAFELISKQFQHAQKQVAYLDYMGQTTKKIFK
jgi:hypothetical protein